MVGESLAIIAVIIVFSAMIAKAGRGIFAAFTLPLVSIPVLHLAAQILHMNLFAFRVAGLVLGVLLALFFSRALRARKGRTGYLVFCGFFLVALFLAYQVNLM